MCTEASKVFGRLETLEVELYDEGEECFTNTGNIGKIPISINIARFLYSNRVRIAAKSTSPVWLVTLLAYINSVIR